MSITRYLPTTKDNPFNPFDQFDEWFQFDDSHGYHTLEVMADRAITSNGLLSPQEDEDSISDAIDEMILEFPMMEYEKLSKVY
jgi:hypothetical protein